MSTISSGATLIDTLDKQIALMKKKYYNKQCSWPTFVLKGIHSCLFSTFHLKHLQQYPSVGCTTIIRVIMMLTLLPMFLRLLGSLSHMFALIGVILLSIAWLFGPTTSTYHYTGQSSYHCWDNRCLSYLIFYLISKDESDIEDESQWLNHDSW